jgi:hypothetical protein
MGDRVFVLSRQRHDWRPRFPQVFRREKTYFFILGNILGLKCVVSTCTTQITKTFVQRLTPKPHRGRQASYINVNKGTNAARSLIASYIRYQ